ncbi:hypothetical protein [Pseudophaeobacter sp. C1-32P7]|uniref:hypothetical protein n=1 Tax=Pseudophaeobacter sp. C1-32P7 TaxID=3098142 RepID=UPI0034D59427
MPLKFLHVAAVMVAVTLIALPRNSMAETGPLLVELNKTEEIDGGGCRAFFLFRNQTGKSFAGFEMSLAILDAGGVIDRLLSVDAAPLPVQRTTLKLFEIPDIACGNISEILLHDITSCQPQNEEQMDCFPILNLESRAAAQLVK